ncbi:30S ribosomal protein S5 [Mycoplasma zalophi]|uniref:Small ribosomal subunit protein uS5 n=1 Tax=Mycoplasma zalophi TaxID=191287 RepID=A0ABS6DQH2_9MOLU|nr:30S ribosomal protein S5 [Mycoplasma zalophi]MBU4691343.1 30S ribosomal protein S5 [Mycoplasma zalophi]MBU4692569.1 30S ribosomal protein S5 [Mycoplasma zalophi]
MTNNLEETQVLTNEETTKVVKNTHKNNFKAKENDQEKTEFRREKRPNSRFNKQDKDARRSTRRPREFNAVNSEFEEKVVNIARVTVVVKGGRRFSFSAYVSVGNKKGKIGFGHGKANEVQDAIKKAVKDAHKNIFEVPIVNGTIPHEMQAKFLASKVQLRPARKGAGIIASNTVRSVVELAGYTDISTKTYGSRNKQNIVYATIKALKNLKTAKEIAELRDIKVSDL